MIPGRDPEANLSILEALVGDLERYLESNELAHRVVYEHEGQREATTLTLGTLVAVTEALKESANLLGDDESRQLADLLDRLDVIRSKYRSAYEEKLARELKSLQDSWSWFLDDCARDDSSCRDDYGAEVWLRTRIQQLLDHGAANGFDVADAEERCRQLDAVLKDLLVEGPYVGPEGEEAVYPRSSYWWLYGQPA